MSTLRKLFLLALLPATLDAQDSLVVISPLVGTVIDPYEAARYDVLRAFSGLRQASFTETPEGQYRARLVLRSGSEVRETTFTISAASLRNIHARIEHRSEMEAGTYRVVGDTCRIGRGAREVPLEPKRKKWYAPSPASHFDIGPALESPYPAFYLHAGVTQVAPRVEGMAEAVRAVEDLLETRGYIVFPQGKEPKLDPIVFLYGIGVTVNPELSISVETGTGSREGGGVTQKSWFGSATFVYTPPVLNFGWVRFGLAASLYGWGNSMTVEYTYNTRSAPDSIGGFLFFRGIRFVSGGRRWGGSFQLVGDVLFDGLPILSAYVRYTGPTPMSIPAPEMLQSLQDIKVELPRVSAGMRLSIHL